MLRRSSKYEEAVDKALLASVQPGDIVWDVGANIGHYSVKLADRVGDGGRVLAFEPSPSNLERLRATTSAYSNITVMQIGLSSTAGRAHFVQGEDQIGATSRLSRPSETAEANAVEVELTRGGDLVASGAVPQPDAIKIDVEGHELEVLEGLSEVLTNPQLRALVIEVHFGLLAEAGRASAPKDIERLLERAGFKRSWIDASHLHATRDR
jgi:FkbM family methyltransferase